jgi:cytochrome bd ubiquinol oxidase subunit II
MRGVSFEFRAKVDSARWKRTWDLANFGGSLIPAIVWGAAFTDLVHGVPLSADGRYYGGLPGLLHPIALVGGLTSLSVFAFHGSVFLTLKTTGELQARARRAAFDCGLAATLLLIAMLAWLGVAGRPAAPGSVSNALPLGLGVVAAGAIAVACLLTRRARDGWAFFSTGLTILSAMGAIFARMFPDVLPASNRAVDGLTIAASASQHNTLVVMSVAAAIFVPFVLAYTGWTYWVFRQRLVRPPGPGPSAPGKPSAPGTPDAVESRVRPAANGA